MIDENLPSVAFNINLRPKDVIDESWWWSNLPTITGESDAARRLASNEIVKGPSNRNSSVGIGAYWSYVSDIGSGYHVRNWKIYKYLSTNDSYYFTEDANIGLYEYMGKMEEYPNYGVYGKIIDSNVVALSDTLDGLYKAIEYGL